MNIQLKPGEKVTICFADSDGEIDVEFSEKAITVTTDLADTKGRKGVIYSEEFGAYAHDSNERNPNERSIGAGSSGS